MSLKLDYLAFISQIVGYSDSHRRSLASINAARLCIKQLRWPYCTPEQVWARSSHKQRVLCVHMHLHS